MSEQLDLQDQIRGVIYGQAVSDALGLGAEFMSKAEVRSRFPNGLRRFSQVDRRGFKPGDWSDDTDQMLCILESLVAQKAIDPGDIAGRIYLWAKTNGRGMGRTVRNVVSSANFLGNPFQAAKDEWERSGKQAAANGAVMRTSVVGIWDFWDQEQVIENARKAALVTHADPRCVASSVAISVAIAELLKAKDPDTTAIFDAAVKAGARFDPGIMVAACPTLGEIRLDEPEKFGYTYKTAGAGLWALRSASITRFEDGVLEVIHEGGDADTNAAVAGAVLGARFGYKAIPTEWTSKLTDKEFLDLKVEALSQLVFERMPGDL
jgi:ADP-ribosylglycohydrolase